MLVGAASYLLWSLTTGHEQGAAGVFLLVLVLGAAVAVILLRKEPRVSELRWAERAVFGAVTIYLGSTAYLALADFLAAGDRSLDPRPCRRRRSEAGGR